jgi:arylsulfatase A-like enzyme
MLAGYSICPPLFLARKLKMTFSSRILATIVLLLAVSVSTTSRCQGEEKTANRPNVLLIVVDDMGYSDIGPFGGEIRTPNLDALAKSGMLFTDFHTAPTCSPTRSMLLSGTDNHLAGLGSMGECLAPNQEGKPGYEGHLNQRVVSFATLVRVAGYFTCMSGKWHLGEEIQQDPSRRGFQESFALLPGGASHFDDEWMLSANCTPIYRENGIRVHVPKGFYSTEFYTSKLVEYLDSRTAGQPFFAYLSFTAPHDPLHVPDDWIDKYEGKYDIGYDALLQERLKRLKELGLVAQDVKPFPRLPMVPDWDKLTDNEKRVEARKMELYAAMIENIDHHLGRMFRHLKETDDWENTLVIFFSDNGANGVEMHQYPQTDKAWVERNSDNRFDNMGRQFSRIATGPAWAQVSMTPYRMFKGFPAEGGIRSPLIVRGPGVAKPGTRSDAFSHVMDIAATVLDVSMTPHPGPSYKGRKIERLRGRSLLPVLRGKAEVVYRDDTAVSWELFGFRAVRKGDFKLLWLPKPFGTGDWQLYDLAKDPGELNDLSTHRRELRDEMADIWEKYARETGVVLPSSSPLGLKSQ